MRWEKPDQPPPAPRHASYHTALENHPEIELVSIFGSVARGEARAESGTDVAVLPQPLDISKKTQLAADIAATTWRSPCAPSANRC